MTLPFFKYEATGNDFVIIDNRDINFLPDKNQIAKMCDRKFGIGADGLILIEKHKTLDFNLIYYNSDGSASLCGNGSRAAVKMTTSLGITGSKTKFNAYDGMHEAELLHNGHVRLKMNNVDLIQKIEKDFFIHTGSPHFIRFVDNVKKFPVFEEGKKIRYSNAYQPQGTNANFVELLNDNSIFVRTYERGVENETLSCGTGVTAAAIAASYKNYKSPVSVKTLGGELWVEFSVAPNGSFTDVYLVGPAKKVFEGMWTLE
ncbi:MAG: diaminopimelate epimerase [Bacteroidetes bacterium]|nr:diaminopimelate epimerase [Bacteroidota bacterium]MBS1539124.1 diaminopimelate epimerase [Bacteroidota bacterium]